MGIDVLRQAIADFVQSDKLDSNQQDPEKINNIDKTLESEFDSDLIQDIDYLD